MVRGGETPNILVAGIFETAPLPMTDPKWPTLPLCGCCLSARRNPLLAAGQEGLIVVAKGIGGVASFGYRRRATKLFRRSYSGVSDMPAIDL